MTIEYHKQKDKVLELEEQLAEANDTIELLALDKEQLSVEKELAEHRALEAEEASTVS